ncbi:hypothetical protein JNUCC64_11910 [Streptomyces sp. JNUCC 64]
MRQGDQNEQKEHFAGGGGVDGTKDVGLADGTDGEEDERGGGGSGRWLPRQGGGREDGRDAPRRHGRSVTLTGCLLALVAVASGLAVWLEGAGPGVSGSFEGERDLSLVYAELPLMLFGVPALTLAV